MSGGSQVFSLDSNDKLLEKWGISPAFSGLAVGDLDGDGEDEVIVGDAHHMEISDTAGVLRDSLDRSATFFPFLAAGDVYGDGRDELIAPEVVAPLVPHKVKIFRAGSTIPPSAWLETEFRTSFTEPISGSLRANVRETPGLLSSL